MAVNVHMKPSIHFKETKGRKIQLCLLIKVSSTNTWKSFTCKYWCGSLFFIKSLSTVHWDHCASLPVYASAMSSSCPLYCNYAKSTLA